MMLDTNIASLAILLLLPVHAIAQFTCVNKPDGFFPHPSDCTSYYICAVGLVYNVKCASGLHYNALMKYCDLPQNANCASNVVPITQPTQHPARTTQQNTPRFTNTPLPVTNSPSKTTQKQSTQKASGSYPYWIFTSRPTSNIRITPSTIHPTFPPIMTNKPVSTLPPILTIKPVIIPSPNNICSGKSSGLYPDPSDCGHYYQCVYGLTIRQPCPPNLVFSSGKNTCAYQVNVPRCFNYQYPG